MKLAQLVLVAASLVACGPSRSGGRIDIIDEVAVTTTTGEDGTDEEILFCFERADTFEDECWELDSSEDDFEPFTTTTYLLEMTPAIEVDAGEPAITTIDFVNEGDDIFSGEWDLDAFRVAALLREGSERTLCSEADVEVTLGSGDVFSPLSCP